MDKLVKERRSWNMSRIRATDTGPEWVVRRALYSMGLRYRLHRKDLPGRPDIVLTRCRAVIFVHGCFWHQHSLCVDGKKRKSNAVYWSQKLTGNTKRDRRHRAALKRLGWKVVVIWECETASKELLQSLLRKRIGLSLKAGGEALSFPKAPPNFHRE